MGQYQTRPSKSETDLESRGNGIDIQQPDDAVPTTDNEPLKDDQLVFGEHVFGSPRDTGGYIESSGSSTTETFPQKWTEPRPIVRTKRMTERTQEERTIPFVFRWDSGGEEVYLCGSFNNWETKIPLNHSQGDLTAIVELPLGTYEYKFVVDGQWVHDPNEISVDNGLGSRNNVVTVVQMHFDAYYESWDLLDKGESSPKGVYTQQMPSRSAASGLPPLLPPLLQQTILNQEQPQEEDSIILPEPNHVILNHLYALSIKWFYYRGLHCLATLFKTSKPHLPLTVTTLSVARQMQSSVELATVNSEEDNVLVLAATHRYKEKFVTTLTYRPVSI